ncbi:MAG: hypothetical protein ACRDRT_02840, partial [Pseudonocardiaceae bacterium]
MSHKYDLIIGDPSVEASSTVKEDLYEYGSPVQSEIAHWTGNSFQGVTGYSQSHGADFDFE